MMSKTRISERGQALVLVVLAIVGLVGLTAVSVDGGMAYLDRRQAQNAADAAALAAAVTKIRSGDWPNAGLTRAASNGYTNDGTNEVEIYLCSDWQTVSGTPCPGMPTGADPAEYILVRIKSVVKLFFAPVVGWREITNRTSAVVQASSPKVTPWYKGKALVSTMTGCRSAGDPHDPFTVGGNGTTLVNNSGIFVNSSCNPAFTDNGNSNSVTTTEGVCVVGGVPNDVTGVNPYPNDLCSPQIDPATYVLPNPEACAQAGTISGSGGNYEATPGYFNKTGNQTFPDVSPSGTLKLQKGIYCLYNGISLNGNWNITTDVDDDNVHDSDTEGVFFFIPDGDVTFNGGSTLELHAINSLANGFPERFINYLIYIPPTNEAEVTITGNNGSTFTGTILAPTSHVTLNGSGNAFSLDTQIIGYDLTITGGGTIDITYHQGNQAVTTTQPALSVTH